jgi:hypothetical protein
MCPLQSALATKKSMEKKNLVWSRERNCIEVAKGQGKSAFGTGEHQDKIFVVGEPGGSSGVARVRRKQAQGAFVLLL